MENINPFIVSKDKPQEISSKQFKEGVLYDFELILPFKAILCEYRGNITYLHLCAISNKDEKLSVSEVFKGEKIMIDFPIKTFNRSWLGVNHLFRSQITENDNVRLVFKKKSKESIMIISYEKIEPTHAQKDFAEKNYVEPEKFSPKKTIIRTREEF